MAGKSTRERIRDQRQRQRARNRLIWSGLAGGAVVLLAALLWPRQPPLLGVALPVMASSAHVEEGTDPGPFNSDPPTSGRHYSASLPAGFYDEGQAATYGEYPEGHLVHSLEHGYVIFWYSCEPLSPAECDQLKSQIREVMDDSENFKVIAFPWPSIDESVVMTSWGRMLRMQEFDVLTARQFVRAYRNQAPEPQGP